MVSIRGLAGLPKIYYGTRSPQGFEQGCALTIGAFDGVHRGHQLILKRVVDKAAELKLPSVAVTFYPDPVSYFSPEQAPAQIMSWREKTLALLESGIDAVVCLPFNESMRSMAAATFVEEILSKSLNAKFVLVGDDFRFGLRREGDFLSLVKLGRKFGFETEQSGTHKYSSRRISSTEIRRLLKDGNLAEASKLLGKPYEICGRVVRGEQLGRTLGFPTANILLKRQKPALTGVFAVNVQLECEHEIASENEAAWYRGAANLGYRPAINTVEKPLLEVHLLDYTGDLYGKRVKVRFEKKLRDEKHFSDLESLKFAISKDVEDVRSWFSQLS